MVDIITTYLENNSKSEKTEKQQLKIAKWEGNLVNQDNSRFLFLVFGFMFILI